MTRRVRYGISLLASTALFAVINLFILLRIPSCCDFIYPYGFPLPFFVRGGMAGIREFLLSGLVIDVVVLIMFAAAISWTWKRLSSRYATQLRNQ
jgi:hypothetical protein